MKFFLIYFLSFGNAESLQVLSLRIAGGLQ